MKYFILSLLMLNSLFIQSQNKCNITYVSNEGFLVETKTKKIAFDAFFDKIDGNWCDSPSDSMLHLMNNALAPFNNIDVIAISHNHRDHFNDQVVVKYLLYNKTTIVVCPVQVKDVLLNHPDYYKFKDRVIAVTPLEYSDTNIVIAGIPFRIMRFEHSHYMIEDTTSSKMVNKHRNIENLGYLVEVDGAKIFHCGDTNPLNKKEYSTYKLNEENIDIAFLERLFYAHGKAGIDMINTYINPKQIIAMHINPSNKPMFANYFKQIENTYILENRLDSLMLEY